MSRLAICVPTYNRAEIIDRVITNSIDYLKRYDIDIYYYDSSENDGTEKLVIRMNESGYDNVYYIKLPSEITYGEKIDYIFSGEGLQKDYDYIWPIKDRIIPNELRIMLALSKCDGKSDVVISLCMGDIFEGDSCYLNSPLELYKYFSAPTTSLETAIYNRKSMFDDYTYGACNSLDRAKSEFWQYWYLYTKLSKMPNPEIAVVSKTGAGNFVGDMQSSWSHRVFEVWIDEFVKVNFDLPDMYNSYKVHAIKATTSIVELLGTKETFLKLHADGVFTSEVFEKYKDVWTYITNVPLEVLEKISKEPTD